MLIYHRALLKTSVVSIANTSNKTYTNRQQHQRGLALRIHTVGSNALSELKRFDYTTMIRATVSHNRSFVALYFYTSCGN